MLIQALVDQALSPDITSLGWVERYGGIVQTAKDVTGMDQNEQAIIKRLPVSCSVNQADCNNDQFYQALVPDSSKKSILYWEVLSGMEDVGQQGSSDVYRTLTGRLRLVGWLNLDALGIRECNATAGAIMSLWAIIKRKRIIKLATAPYDKSTLDFRVVREVVRDPNIFASYDYPSDWSYLFYPYDYFALEVSVSFKTCFPTYDLPTGAVIECTDSSRI